jgi:hypothetical protein
MMARPDSSQITLFVHLTNISNKMDTKACILESSSDLASQPDRDIHGISHDLVDLPRSLTLFVLIRVKIDMIQYNGNNILLAKYFKTVSRFLYLFYYQGLSLRPSLKTRFYCYMQRGDCPIPFQHSIKFLCHFVIRN